MTAEEQLRYLRADYRRLHHEVERLRAALKDIAVIGVGTTSARDDALEMQSIAAKALTAAMRTTEGTP